MIVKLKHLHLRRIELKFTCLQTFIEIESTVQEISQTAYPTSFGQKYLTLTNISNSAFSPWTVKFSHFEPFKLAEENSGHRVRPLICTKSINEAVPSW